MSNSSVDERGRKKTGRVSANISRRAALGLTAGAAGTLAAPSLLRAQTRQIVIGGKAFTEQYVQAEITRQMLERAGFAATTRLGYSTEGIRAAQLAGEIDISWDYTWTGWSIHHGRSEWRPTPEILSELRRLDAPQGLVWLDSSAMNSSYTWMVNLDYAAENCMHSLSELAFAVRNGLFVRLASDQECHIRQDCLQSVETTYDFMINRDLISVMNVADTYEELRLRQVEIGVGYTTDGKIIAYDLETLEDPKGAFAEYLTTAVVREDLLEEAPEVRQILDAVSGSVDTASARDLGYRVDVIGQPLGDVASYHIASQSL